VTPPARLRAEDADEVAALFGLRPSGPLVVAARGELGRVWRLPTGTGPVAVKDLFAPPTEPEAAADVEFQRLARDAGVVLPEPLSRPDGRILAELRSGVTVRAYRWVDLRPLGERPVEAVGALLATLHRAAPRVTAAPHPWFTEPVGAAAWTDLVTAARAAGAPFGDALDTLVRDQRALDADLLPVAVRGDERRCHLDLDDTNLAWDPRGRLTVLDWENSGPASPGRELAMVAAEYGPGAATRLVAAYRAAGGPARLSTPDDFAMAVAVQGHLIEFYARRWLTSPDPEDRDRSIGRIDEIAAGPLTRAGIDEVLAATRAPA
jgi:Ser/Thr protein kinase RdoA (MazF antagonist)